MMRAFAIKLKTYYRLTKPGIIRGNAITATGGFLFASQGHPEILRFIAMLAGICLVMASGCVFNNYIDRDIDKKMARTKNRALVTGQVSLSSAITFGIMLGLIGALILAFYTNILTLSIALFGLFVYVVVYGIGKRRTVHGTVIGSVSGAVPPVVGYTAAANQLDSAALLLFSILVFWQMPHFYAIAMYRLKDYQAAKIPVLPIKKGMFEAKIQILAYITAFMLAVAMLTGLGYTGYTYLLVMIFLGYWWLWLGIQSFKKADYQAWGRKMFGFSLLVLMTFSLMISVDVWLP